MAFYRNSQMYGVRFWHTDFVQLILHCVIIRNLDTYKTSVLLSGPFSQTLTTLTNLGKCCQYWPLKTGKQSARFLFVSGMMGVLLWQWYIIIWALDPPGISVLADCTLSSISLSQTWYIELVKVRGKYSGIIVSRHGVCCSSKNKKQVVWHANTVKKRATVTRH